MLGTAYLTWVQIDYDDTGLDYITIHGEVRAGCLRMAYKKALLRAIGGVDDGWCGISVKVKEAGK